MTDLTLPAGSAPARAEAPVVAVALAALIVGAGGLGSVYGWRQGALYLLGGPSVHSFVVSMIVGVIVATYSSIYVSTGLAILLGVSREDLLPPKEKEIDEMP